ncbi:LacI family DNA-binding transcriptional regulator [Ligilactobacillus sp. LYQ112]|uniref:LacI family DNA-binding transcriptional regulator n=1 Tax=Ligilactobacillus sp. LYQ112 TaxID=3391060 RepID=UPI0039830706
MKPTIKDIAARAGVSIASVSRILANKTGSFNVKTGERVRQIAQEMGYQRNETAATLVRQQSNVIAVIINNTPTPFADQVIHGIQHQANAAEKRVIMLSAGDNNTHLQHQAIQTALQRTVTAIILVGVFPDDQSTALLTAAHVPFCFAATRLPAYPFVSSDDYWIAYQAANYLIEHGHRRLALVGIDQGPTGTQRQAGFQSALTNAKIDIPPVIINGDYGRKVGITALPALKSHSVSAVVAGSDMVGAGIIQEAHHEGLHLPDDLSIICIDGTYICELTTPQLTSVTQNFAQIGAAAVDRVLNHTAITNIPTVVTPRESVKRIRK